MYLNSIVIMKCHDGLPSVVKWRRVTGSTHIAPPCEVGQQSCELLHGFSEPHFASRRSTAKVGGHEPCSVLTITTSVDTGIKNVISF